MTKYVSFRDGGETDEKGISRYVSKFLTGEVFTGLNVTQQGTPAMGVTVAVGDCMIDSGSGYPYIGWNDASTNVTISTADGTNPRYDLIVAYIDLSVVSSASPNNPGALVIDKVTGTPAGSPVVPNNTAIHTAIGASNPYIILARVRVNAGATTITNSDVLDMRVLVSNNLSDATLGWNSLNASPSAVVDNGNGSYNLTLSSVDKTSILSPGMKLKLTKTVTSPTLCTDLESSSSQYYSKSSPANMTFTDDFAVSAWIKLESYANNKTICSRFNGTSGWRWNVGGSGEVVLEAFNAGGANYSQVTSYQSIPLNKWVHVAAQLDMSSFTATTTTSYIMIDGLDVPASVARSGTNPTALVQAGNLEVGSDNGSNFFDGKIAQVAIYNAKVTQSTIQASRNQTLSGSETNLISAYSFNNSINDLNTGSANNLSAQNSAVATNTDTPFTQTQTGITAGTTNYGIVMSASFSTDTTVVVQVPDGETLPTTGGISAVSYSTQAVPFGFPKQRGKWTLQTLYKTTQSQSSPTQNAWYNVGSARLTIPVGEWNVGYTATVAVQKGSNPAASVNVTLSTANNTESDTDFTAFVYMLVLTSATHETHSTLTVNKNISTSSATPYYLNLKTQEASTTTMYLDGALTTGGRVSIDLLNSYI